ncbi:hypothetical protein ASF87_00455 [Microbacterium sp. Leaf161]|uniref:WXG100 family type VII secretion target n=1 Tax=Microbacterium sp. Leaf161 TaxID=1736281 RepID=UPI0006FA66E5|nr:WXG100 family type VII secretion target [Microbacterium sp. Leaf161]KQR47492.1 hypothetical protein ASF87_00455 [Microbacterium sp. Leaf161]
MNSRIISIEHDQLDAACTEISEHVRQIDAELDRLEAAADALSWQWSGEAQVAYRVAQREWHQSMREMTAIAHALSAIAHRGNNSFRAQDRRDAAVWAR